MQNGRDHRDTSKSLISAEAKWKQRQLGLVVRGSSDPNAEQVPVITAFHYIIPVHPDVHKQHKLTWQGVNGGIQEKQSEGRGFCVCGVSCLITRETSNRPDRGFEAGKHRRCGYLWCQIQYSDCKLFPGLRLCLSGKKAAVLGLYIRRPNYSIPLHLDEALQSSGCVCDEYYSDTNTANCGGL